MVLAALCRQHHSQRRGEKTVRLVLRTDRDRQGLTVVRSSDGGQVWFQHDDELLSPKGTIVYEFEWDSIANSAMQKLWGFSALDLLHRHSFVRDGAFCNVAWIPLREGIVRIRTMEFQEPSAVKVDKVAPKQLLEQMLAACNAAINEEFDGKCNVDAKLE